MVFQLCEWATRAFFLYGGEPRVVPTQVLSPSFLPPGKHGILDVSISLVCWMQLGTHMSWLKPCFLPHSGLIEIKTF